MLTVALIPVAACAKYDDGLPELTPAHFDRDRNLPLAGTVKKPRVDNRPERQRNRQKSAYHWPK